MILKKYFSLQKIKNTISRKSNLIKKTETGEIKSIRNGKLIKIPKECLIEYVLNAM